MVSGLSANCTARRCLLSLEYMVQLPHTLVVSGTIPRHVRDSLTVCGYPVWWCRHGTCKSRIRLRLRFQVGAAIGPKPVFSKLFQTQSHIKWDQTLGGRAKHLINQAFLCKLLLWPVENEKNRNHVPEGGFYGWRLHIKLWRARGNSSSSMCFWKVSGYVNPCLLVVNMLGRWRSTHHLFCLLQLSKIW